jgi:hypothetical protein
MSEEKTEAEAEPKKAWICREMATGEVEEYLNRLAEDGYQIFKVDRLESPIPGEHTFQVIAFDPIRVMKLMQKGQAENLAEMMRTARSASPFGASSMPGVPTGGKR